jgi:hypothetical protein
LNERTSKSGRLEVYVRTSWNLNNFIPSVGRSSLFFFFFKLGARAADHLRAEEREREKREREKRVVTEVGRT